ncbi:ATP-binding protein [Microbacterium sp. STN6]|uniref:AAA family ATPase n=1 Tax=Microbacterium sp. STN6 TaxID=2995588 RepID=UPI002260FBB6|nr:ATP-binding protein [Microbacterium sp. STN6]MCX7521752.1 ATP-binding protein [Microbacterium sp. STN6]
MSCETLAPGPQYVVLVLGRPASGKSTISSKIADRWHLPVVSKDALKESLFDSLGTGDVAWSVKLGRASFALLDQVIELQLRAGKPFLIDAAYSAEFENAKFRKWQDRYGFVAIQIHCTASPEELVRRFTRRALDGTRHPGHADTERVEEFRRVLVDGRFGLLDLRGPVLHYESERAESAQTLLHELEALLPA